MSRRLTLILGGARSGKSRYALRLAAERSQQNGQSRPVLYVATAQAGDDEMRERIAAHRAERPGHWRTLEAPLNAGAAIAALPDDYAVVLVDCLTLLANNVIAPLPEPVTEAPAARALQAEVDGLLAARATSRAEWIIISNEVGLGLVPPYPLGRAYRDALGRANQGLAAAADEVLFMVSGLPLKLK